MSDYPAAFLNAIDSKLEMQENQTSGAHSRLWSHHDVQGYIRKGQMAQGNPSLKVVPLHEEYPRQLSLQHFWSDIP
jgi:hypothetical protein